MLTASIGSITDKELQHMHIYQDTILGDLFTWNQSVDQDGKTQEFILKCNKLHNNKYDYSRVRYKNSMHKISIICPDHGEFVKNPRDHLNGSGCPECQRLTRSITSEDYLSEAKKVHNDCYDYTLTKFKNARTKVIVVCKYHGSFEISGYSHIRGVGCQSCKLDQKYKNDKEEFIKKANKKHNNKFDYSQVDYRGTNTPVNIGCPDHGEFSVTPYGHLMGAGGCAHCYGNNLKTIQQFIDDAQKKHGTRYDYSLSQYINAKTPLIIICRSHGQFKQQPNNHLSGSECPRCNINKSKIERNWLDSLNVPMQYRQQKIMGKSGKMYVVDGFEPQSNTVYEFNGDFWHGNPKVHDPNQINRIINKTFKQLHEETLRKEQDLKDNGYTVVSIWESDWRSMSTQWCAVSHAGRG
jgi:hypothetical protein